ncbi:MAG TPA: hypothetical protein VGO33_06920 [Gemmatimonadaceae bacterium]|jgi:hypothetical protein|nr:hypothetical protein [Gemmatimonadaceae bacterium]
MRLSLAFATVVLPALLSAQDPPKCTVLKSEVTLGPVSGHRIDSVFVETAKPQLGRLASLVEKIHVRTRPDVVRRELLFAPGDTVDTLSVAESLRRLRKLSYLEYARVEARQCPTQSGELLALTVVTRDSWTTRPDIRASSTSPRIGLTERNLMGTGRTVGVDIASRNGTLGIGFSTSDAFGFGTGMATRAQVHQYPDGSTRSISLARRQATLTDKWRGELSLYDQQYEPRNTLSDNFERTGAELLGGIRLTPRRSAHALYLLAGVESENTALVAAQNADVVGPIRIDRHFTGPQLGVSVVSALYDTLTWLVPGGAVVDVPRSVEGELVVGVGRGSVVARDTAGPTEIGHANLMTHYDGWLGREWLPTRRSRIVGDIWASGYSRAGQWQSSRMRAAISAEHAASNGVWRLSIAGEQLRDPDPDVRTLGIYDRALAFVPRRMRFAESAMSLSAERTRHLKSFGSQVLDASIFGAASWRWDPASAGNAAEGFTVGVAGIGVALVPRRPGAATVRLDYGIPLVATPGFSRVPRFSITIVPWLEASRGREKSGLR